MSATDEASPTCPVWHPSFMPAALPEPAPHAPTAAGLYVLAALRNQLNAEKGDAAPRRAAEVVRAAWHDMPKLYRRMVVAAAGLPAEVVDIRDRELTEHHKVMMRSAISDMRTWLESVAAL
jgi:hypothetical protein